MIKRCIALLLVSLLLFSLTGCYDARGLETLSYAVAIGIDKGNDNLLRLSIQFAAPGSGGGGSSTQQFTNTTVTTVECASIDSGINLINSYISNQINLAHAKIIVISESLASEGVAPYISTFVNNVEVRPDCNIIISRCSAEDFLNNSQPTLETLSARYYEQVLNSSQYTGFTTNTTLSSFYSAYRSPSYQPVAILGGINANSTHSVNPTTTYVDLDASYKANETPIKNKTSLEIMGLAIFNEDKLIGELAGIDSVCHLMCTNKFNSSTISFPSPFNQNSIMDLSIQENGKADIDVHLLNGSPYIKIKVPLLATVASMEYKLNLSSSENIIAIENYAASYLKEKMLNYLYATSKNYHCDIANFGKYLTPMYLTKEDWEKVDWLHLYADSVFDVEIEVQVKSSYLLVTN